VGILRSQIKPTAEEILYKKPWGHDNCSIIVFTFSINHLTGNIFISSEVIYRFNDPKLIALQFNEFINQQNIPGLTILLMEDHRFID